MKSPQFPRFDETLPGSEPPLPKIVPPVVKWYKAYCVLMVLVFIAGVAAGGVMVMNHAPMNVGGTVVSADDVGSRGMVLMLVCVVLFAINVAALFLPRRPWAWIYHLVNISISIANCWFFLTIPLLYFWIKPETQKYYGYNPPVKQ